MEIASIEGVENGSVSKFEEGMSVCTCVCVFVCVCVCVCMCIHAHNSCCHYIQSRTP